MHEPDAQDDGKNGLAVRNRRNANAEDRQLLHAQAVKRRKVRVQHDRAKQHGQQGRDIQLASRIVSNENGQEIEARIVDDVQNIVGRAVFRKHANEIQDSEDRTHHARCHEHRHDRGENAGDDLEEAIAPFLLATLRRDISAGI